MEIINLNENEIIFLINMLKICASNDVIQAEFQRLARIHLPNSDAAVMLVSECNLIIDKLLAESNKA